MFLYPVAFELSLYYYGSRSKDASVGSGHRQVTSSERFTIVSQPLEFYVRPFSPKLYHLKHRTLPQIPFDPQS